VICAETVVGVPTTTVEGHAGEQDEEEVELGDEDGPGVDVGTQVGAKVCALSTVHEADEADDCGEGLPKTTCRMIGPGVCLEPPLQAAMSDIAAPAAISDRNNAAPPVRACPVRLTP
jgi:hypothetical protein